MEYLSVKDAALKIGKSTSAIRRIIYPIIADDHHADRMHVLPSVEEVMQLRMKGESFGWRVSEEVIRRFTPAESSGNSHGSRQPGASTTEGDLIALLRQELTIKNQQITVQNELISKQIELNSGLSERLREGNVLIATLQQRITLTDVRIEPAMDAVVTESSPAKAEKVNKSEKGNSKPEKSRKSFLSRIFT